MKGGLGLFLRFGAVPLCGRLTVLCFALLPATIERSTSVILRNGVPLRD